MTKKKIYGATEEELEKAEIEFRHLLDNPDITSFTDAMLTGSFMSNEPRASKAERDDFSGDGIDNESVLKFEEEHGKEYYKAFREILK